MPSNRWLDKTQPQTLYIAVLLLYLNAAFSTLTLLLGGLGGVAAPLLLAMVAGQVGGGYGIANEKKWGYALGLLMAFAPFILNLVLAHTPFVGDLITLMFEIALVALLLHPQSREYQRIWFK